MCEVQRQRLPSTFIHSALRLASPTQLPKRCQSRDVMAQPLTQDTAFMSFWDFEAANSGQVDLKKGSRVQVLDKDNAEWWYVLVHDSRQKGWCPSNFLISTRRHASPKEKRSKQRAIDSSASSIVSSSSSSSSSSSPSSPGSCSAASAPIHDGLPSSNTTSADTSYHATTTTTTADTSSTTTSPPPSSNGTQVSSTVGVSGPPPTGLAVPSHHVDRGSIKSLSQLDRAAGHQHHLTGSTSGHCALTKTKSESVIPTSTDNSNAEKVFFYKATKDYVGEVNFRSGDILRVLETSRDAWWTVKHNGLTGKVPAVYLKRLKSSSSSKFFTDKSKHERPAKPKRTHSTHSRLHTCASADDNHSQISSSQSSISQFSLDEGMHSPCNSEIMGGRLSSPNNETTPSSTYASFHNANAIPTTSSSITTSAFKYTPSNTTSAFKSSTPSSTSAFKSASSSSTTTSSSFTSPSTTTTSSPSLTTVADKAAAPPTSKQEDPTPKQQQVYDEVADDDTPSDDNAPITLEALATYHSEPSDRHRSRTMGFDCGAEGELVKSGGSSGWWYVRLTRTGALSRGGISCDKFGWTPSKYWKILK